MMELTEVKQGDIIVELYVGFLNGGTTLDKKVINRWVVEEITDSTFILTNLKSTEDESKISRKSRLKTSYFGVADIMNPNTFVNVNTMYCQSYSLEADKEQMFNVMTDKLKQGVMSAYENHLKGVDRAKKCLTLLENEMTDNVEANKKH